MKTFKKITCIALAMALMMGLCACGAKTEGSVVIGTTMAIEKGEKGEYNFDMISSSLSQVPIIYKTSNGDYVGRLVDYSTTDSKTWVIAVKDYKWSDGTAFTAEDILAAIEAEDAYKDRFESKEVSEDGKTLTLVLNAANIKFPADLCTVRPINSKGDNANTWLGPYTFTGFNKEAGTLSFEANKDFGKTPKYKNVVVQVFGSEDAMYLALKNGEIDMVWNYSKSVDPNYQEMLKDAKGLSIYRSSAENLPMVLCFNNSSEPFSEKLFRLAVYYALDYSDIVKYVGSGSSTVANIGVIPPITLGYFETGANEKILEKAANLIDELGYTKNDSGLYMKDGNDAEFTLTVNSSKAAQVSAGELVKTQLESFGIKVKLEVLDTTAYQAKTTNSKSGGHITMEAALMSFTAAGMNMKEGLGTIYMDATHPVQGACQVKDARFTEALLKMRGAKTADEYKAGAKDMQLFIQDEVPLIALYWGDNCFVAAESMGQLTVDGLFGLNTMENFIIAKE